MGMPCVPCSPRWHGPARQVVGAPAHLAAHARSAAFRAAADNDSVGERSTSFCACGLTSSLWSLLELLSLRNGRSQAETEVLRSRLDLVRAVWFTRPILPTN
jgi:hypothetical protein